MQKAVIVIGGLDPSGGAGLASDIKVCAFFNTYPLPVASAITYQNSTRFFGMDVLTSVQIEKQLKSILGFYPVEYAKIGLIGSGKNLNTILSILAEKGIKTIVDPVLKTSTKGKVGDKDLISALKQNAEKIFLLTPNMPEAEEISGLKNKGQKATGMALKESGFKNILVKGGHLSTPDDLLITKNQTKIFKGKRIETQNTRGTGCALSSAIAANLALGKSLDEAVSISKNYLAKAMKHNYAIGNPPYPINLFPEKF